MAGLPHSLRSLLHADAYPHAVSEVSLVETPISWVLLTGEFAYKIKRPVLLPFVDLRAAARRRLLCNEELRLNRRFAPALYLETCAITRTPTGLRVGGDGEVVETAVRMRQFDGREELDVLVQRGDITIGEMARFGAALAALHADLPRAHDPGVPGDPQRTRAAMLRNLAQVRRALARAGIEDDLEDLRRSLVGLQDDLQPFLVDRWHWGKVRECHGDLHARNVVRHGASLVAFDAMEFEPWFRWIDVGQETAFLAMDLQAHGTPVLALAFLSGYLEASGDYGQLRALPLHVADRALVRAKVAALEAIENAGDEAKESLDSARRYLTVARDAMSSRSRRGRLILMHGLSGSGKSWLAIRLAERLRALHLRSDVVRQFVTAPGGAAYSAAAMVKTYEFLANSAADALAGGLDVIVDATFLRRANRADFRRIAAIHGASLVVVHCVAPEATLQARIAERASRDDDPSEATLGVLDLQRERIEPIVASDALAVIPADTTRDDVVDIVAAQLASECRRRVSPSTQAAYMAAMPADTHCAQLRRHPDRPSTY